MVARMAKLVDAKDSKSFGKHNSYEGSIPSPCILFNYGR